MLKRDSFFFQQLKRYETAAIVPSLAHSSSSTKLADLEAVVGTIYQGSTALTLEQLVMWHSDVCLILREIPKILNIAAKQIGLSKEKLSFLSSE